MTTMLRPAAFAFGRQFATRRAAPICLSLKASPRFFAAVNVTIPKPPTSNHRHTPLPNASGTIVYTETDEAPALATYSLYPYISKVSYTILLFQLYSSFPPYKRSGAISPCSIVASRHSWLINYF